MRKLIIALFLGFMSITAGAQFKYEDFELKFQLGKYEFSSSIMMPISKWKKNMTIEDIKEYYLQHGHEISATLYTGMYRGEEKECLEDFLLKYKFTIEAKYDVLLSLRPTDHGSYIVEVCDRETHENSIELEKKRRAKAEKEKEDRMKSLLGLL